MQESGWRVSVLASMQHPRKDAHAEKKIVGKKGKIVYFLKMRIFMCKMDKYVPILSIKMYLLGKLCYLTHHVQKVTFVN